MTRISNVDHVLLLLRQQLQRSERSRDAGRSGQVTRSTPTDARPLDRARALAALDTLSEEETGRAVIRGLLADTFGDEVSSDPAFQNIVDEVFRLVAEMPGGTELLQGAVTQLRAG